jgi:hypothetical protein
VTATSAAITKVKNWRAERQTHRMDVAPARATAAACELATTVTMAAIAAASMLFATAVSATRRRKLPRGLQKGWRDDLASMAARQRVGAPRGRANSGQGHQFARFEDPNLRRATEFAVRLLQE